MSLENSDFYVSKDNTYTNDSGKIINSENVPICKPPTIVYMKSLRNLPGNQK